MHHVGDVKASCSNSCSNQDWHPPNLEVFQRLVSKFKRNFHKLPRYHNKKSSTCSLSLWSLSPWILVAGKPWYDHIVAQWLCISTINYYVQNYLLTKVEAEEVRLPLGLNKHQRPLLGITSILIEDTDELVLLLILRGSVKCLHNICTSPANKSNLKRR